MTVKTDSEILQGPETSAVGAGRMLESVDWTEDAELDVTVIVPVQSPAAPVADLVLALGGELQQQGRKWECLFVFDGVKGQAWDELQKMREAYGRRVRSISFQNPFGESVCLSSALERARGRYIVTSPQYIQVDPVELRPMLAALDEGADVVAPWRNPRIDPWLNRLQSAAFNFIIRRFIRMRFHDLNCYFRAIRREVLNDVAVYGEMYRFIPVIAYRQGYSVVEIKVRHLKEWTSTSIFGLGIYTRRFLDILAVMFLTKFTLKPLRFFGMIGGVFGLTGMAICLWLTIVKFVMHQGVAGRPLLLLGVLLILLGVQILGFGLVGEIIIFSQARNLKEYRIERVYEVVREEEGTNGP